jgi:hypothetical protein
MTRSANANRLPLFKRLFSILILLIRIGGTLSASPLPPCHSECHASVSSVYLPKKEAAKSLRLDAFQRDFDDLAAGVVKTTASSVVGNFRRCDTSVVTFSAAEIRAAQAVRLRPYISCTQLIEGDEKQKEYCQTRGGRNMPPVQYPIFFEPLSCYKPSDQGGGPQRQEDQCEKEGERCSDR